MSCRARFRRFEVHFLQILPSAKRNWQEKTSERALSPALKSTIKPEAAPAMRKPNRGKENNSNKLKITAIHSKIFQITQTQEN